MGTFPLYPLDESYRCHTDVAAFLRRQVYDADGIPYQSARTATVREGDPVSDGVARVLGQESSGRGAPAATDGGAAGSGGRASSGQATFDQWVTESVPSSDVTESGERKGQPQESSQEKSRDSEQSSRPESEDTDSALTLILHDERESRQSNAVEAAIGAALEQSTHEDDKLGIVTPHNAQRGLLNTHLDSVECETVERYQGGERPMIMVSATASDPDFVQVEADFLLNPNRLTVAMSRMQRGLVVVASRTVFDVVPKDVEKYERAGIWKGLYNDLDVLNDEPTWSGQLGAFVGDTEVDLDALGISEESQRESHLEIY
jgi:superfamily I DNA and/or RNA helicase